MALQPRGSQLFVDWRYVDAGEVDWTSNTAPVNQWKGQPPADIRGVATGPSGIRLQTQKAETVGPILLMDRPWEMQYNMYFANAMYEDGIYRAWYTCIPPDHLMHRWSNAAGQVICYAESQDGFNWKKPNLGLYSYHGEPTNVVFGRELSLYGCQSGSIFKDPKAPSEERYKLFYVGVVSSDNLEDLKSTWRKRFGDAGVSPTSFKKGKDGGGTANVICAAISPDGIHWKPIPEPLMIWPSDTLNNVYWDEKLAKYVAYLRLRRDGRRIIVRAESADFLTWKNLPVPVLEPPLEWPPTDDAYTNSHTIYPGSGDTHLMFPGVFHRFTDNRDIYLASSFDGINWKWVPGGPVVECGSLGSWNGGDINPGIGLVPLSCDRIALPIMGYVKPHKFPRGGDQVLGQPGWAIWQKGRISAIIADGRGEFSTMAIRFEGKQLSLNLKTKQAGELLVELQDENNVPIPGYTFADANPITGDSLDRRVTWNGNADISALSGITIVMSFRLRSAQLYAFEFV
ncbi:hypothetical protein ANRL1_01353 [Anaerolineae bacterium]|nr:hypothetical protein ANRL1_01353 [Anaerolineae bacterium]